MLIIWLTFVSLAVQIRNVIYLLKLSKDSGINELFSEKQRNHIDMLMPLNIEARYPDDKMAIMKTLDDAKSESIYNQTE